MEHDHEYEHDHGHEHEHDWGGRKAVRGIGHNGVAMMAKPGEKGTALLSVSDKTGLAEFARRLVAMGIRVISTGGTLQALREAGVEAASVSDRTRFPEILEGRVKTLHPAIHGGILARLDSPAHMRELERLGIAPIHLVVVNLYPFSATVARAGVTREEAVEQIDIGGPCLLRAAAKNAAHVAAVVDPADYPEVAAEMMANQGRTLPETRRRLALKAFQHTAAYDLAIAEYLENLEAEPDGPPASVALALTRERRLRYGENPHQTAALYRRRHSPARGLVAARQLQGKELSFNNYVDLDAAWRLSREFDEPFCGIVKHTNPCGAAVADTPAEAYRRALAADPVSAFGSIIALNRPLDGETAELMKELFVEAVIAPGYQPDAARILASKKNLRLMEMSPETEPATELEWRTVAGGFLAQDEDRYFVRAQDLKTVTRRSPGEAETRDLLFAWRVCKHVKSNAIVVARDGRTVGVGAGQTSRVAAVALAVERLEGKEAALASDAFFPFRDGLDLAARAGVRAVIQPGGSVRDPEVIEAADEHGLAMVFTGVRHFRH